MDHTSLVVGGKEGYSSNTFTKSSWFINTNKHKVILHLGLHLDTAIEDTLSCGYIDNKQKETLFLEKLSGSLSNLQFEYVLSKPVEIFCSFTSREFHEPELMGVQLNFFRLT